MNPFIKKLTNTDFQWGKNVSHVCLANILLADVADSREMKHKILEWKLLEGRGSILFMNETIVFGTVSGT